MSSSLDQFELKQPEKEEIKNCVRYHWARWITEPPEDSARGANPTKKELIVQLSDFFCSRKCASFLPGINLSEEQIKNFLKEKLNKE